MTHSSVELAIIGAGPAGLAAAIHAARAGISHRLVESDSPGGLIRAANLVENLPGYPGGVTGLELARCMVSQAAALGVRLTKARVESIRSEGAAFQIISDQGSGNSFSAETVVLATGTRHISPAIMGMPEALRARLAHWDIRSLPLEIRGARISISGGGDAAFDAALNLASRGASVEIHMRATNPRAKQLLFDRVLGSGISVFAERQLIHLSVRKNHLALVYQKGKSMTDSVEADFALICHGRVPETDLWQVLMGASAPLPGDVATDLPGLFVGGDLIRGRHRYVATAMGDGTRAACLAEEHLIRNKTSIVKKEKQDKMGRLEVIAMNGQPDVAEVFVARVDGRKERTIEFVDGLDVRFPREEKWIVNVSTQYGCPVKCLFCDAGGDYAGSIPAEVMIEQIEHVLNRHPQTLREKCPKLKVHFARMGEPALNDAVLDVMEHLPELIRNPGFWVCVATIVPQGREAWFQRLFEIKKKLYRGRFQLQFSTNSTDADWRRRLMPFPHEDLSKIAALGEAFWSTGDRKAVLNFALAQGIPVDPAVIANIFDPRKFAVKLTPLNPTVRGADEGLRTALAPHDPESVQHLEEQLAALGFETVVSVGDMREDQIGSNCGQAVRRMNLELESA